MLSTADARILAGRYALMSDAFSAFSRGVPVSWERFRAHCDFVYSQVGFDALDDMRALESYANETDDDVWGF